jgi:hypothetical protein
MKKATRYAGVRPNTNEKSEIDLVWTLHECLTCARLLKETTPIGRRGWSRACGSEGHLDIPIIATSAIGINLFARCYV